MKKLMYKINMGIKICKFIASYEPMYIFLFLLNIICSSILPLFYVYVPKMFIELLISGSPYPQIAINVLVYSLILLLIELFKQFITTKSNYLIEKFTLSLKNDIGLITMQLELINVERASNRDIISLANNVYQISSLATITQSIISNVITVLGLSYIIVRLEWVFVMLIALTLIIKAIFVRFQFKYREKQRIKFARNDRVGNYLTDILYFKQGAVKEVRVNNAQNWLMGKITAWRNEMVELQYADYGLYTLIQILSAAMTTIQSFVVLWILTGRYIEKVINIADFTMYYSAITTISTSLSSITSQISEYNRQILNFNDFEKIISYKNPKNKVQEYDISSELITIPDSIEIVLNDVCFAYPDSNKMVLKHINLKIGNREKLAIVGKNGAGKTTFVKLLCKFYRPTSGKITLNGIDIWDIPNDKYYKLISTVFQDFINFAFSLKDNIILNQQYDQNNFTSVIEKVGLTDYIGALKDGVNSYITKLFNDNGIELSGGQEQKLAIARALYKGSPVLILDEPTASLDPKAESEIYDNFFKVAKEKTTIFISHRLAASASTDKIAVFSEGEILEYGTHTQLMNLKGLYAEMFEKQSHAYSN
ncbi:MAG: ABC transporter ATP-binding protein [Clostridiales bacterium]|nr:ABC transporter ATP-binding protein [Clostridiales bacterium]